MAGIYVPWLADAARLTGYPVVEVAGWRTRGHGGMTSVEGVLCHHTAGPRTGEYPSLAVVRDGRAGLAGPLSHLGIGRSGAVYVIAAGTCWHAGESRWLQWSGLNSRFLGIEAEDDGDGRWTPEQLDCYPRLVAALLHYMRRGADRAAAHREVALPLGRKPDPAGIDMPAFRRHVAHLLTDPLRLIPRRAQEDAMTPDQERKLDRLLALLEPVEIVQPDGMRRRVSPMDALVNLYVGMFYGGESTPERRSLLDLVAEPRPVPVHLDTSGVGAAVTAATEKAVRTALGGGLTITGTAVPATTQKG